MSCHLDFGRSPARTRTPARTILRLPALLVLVALVGALNPVDARGGDYGYFTVTPDLRRCVSPLCGGFHLQAFNQPSTTCADGSQQASCYVASADFGALETPPSFGPGTVIVRGQIEADEYPGFGNLGRLVAESAWTGATNQIATGSFYRIRDLGIVCVTTPCFATEARVLNQTAILVLSRCEITDRAGHQDASGSVQALDSRLPPHDVSNQRHMDLREFAQNRKLTVRLEDLLVEVPDTKVLGQAVRISFVALCAPATVIATTTISST